MVALFSYNLAHAVPTNCGGSREAEIEPNDDFANATRVTFVNNNASFLGALNSTSDYDDYYNITIPSGLGLVARLTILSYDETQDFDLYLYNSNDAMVALSASEAEVEALAYRGGDEDAFFYLEAYAYEGTGNYRLELSIVEPPMSDGDDTMDAAFPLNTNPVAPNPAMTDLAYINVTGELSIFDNQDWYKVFLYAGDINQYMTANLTILDWNSSAPSSVDFDIIMYDNWDVLPFERNASFTYQQTESVQGAASYTGQYYLVVRRYSGEGAYSLNITITTVPSDMNNIPSNATLVTNGTTINSTVDQVMDIFDWYKVNLTVGASVDTLFATLVVDYDVEWGTEFAIGVYDSNLVPVDYVSTDSEETIVVTPTQSGIYYIVVIAEGVFNNRFYTEDMGWAAYVTADCARGNYSLEIEVSSLIGDNDNEPENATPALSTQASTVGSAVDYSDWYCIGLAQGTTITVNLTILCGADFDLFLYNSTVLEDPSNAKIGQSDGITMYEEIVSTVDKAGVYYIEVRSIMGTGEGEYILNVSASPSSQPPVILNYAPRPLAGQVMSAGDTMAFSARAMDFNGDALYATWKLDGNVVTGTYSGNDFQYCYTPSNGQSGVHTIELSISDGTSSAVLQWSITVNINNSKPVISSYSPSTESMAVMIGSTTTFSVDAVDPEGAQLSYKWFLDNGSGYQQVATTKSYDFIALPSMAGMTMNVHVEVIDDIPLTETMTWQVSVEQNALPVISSYSPGMVSSVKEGNSIAFEVNATDPEGTALSYTWFYDGVELSGEGTNRYMHDFNYTSQGDHTFRCNVTDEYGGVQEVVWAVHVDNVNNVPQITRLSPAQSTLTISEGQSVVFNVSVTDPDGDRITSIRWFRDGIELDFGDSYTFNTDSNSAGEYNFQVVARDINGGESNITWKVTVQNLNQAPKISTMYPLNGSKFDEGEAVIMMAEASDADGDVLDYIWKEKGEVIGTGISISKTFKAGKHTIVLTVDDGKGLSDSREANFTISAKPESTPGLDASLTLVALACGAGCSILGYRRRCRNNI